MSRKSIFTFVALTTILFQTACSSKPVKSSMDEKINQKLEQMSLASDRKDLQSIVDQQLTNDKLLTSEQKVKLQALRKQLKAALDDLSSQSLKLRAVLIKDVLSQNYDPEEVRAIKNRLHDVEWIRLSTMFNAVDEANEILKHGASHQYFLNDLIYSQELIRN